MTSTDERVVEGGFSLAVWDGVGWTYQYQLLGSVDPVETAPSAGGPGASGRPTSPT